MNCSLEPTTPPSENFQLQQNYTKYERTQQQFTLC